MIRPAFRRFIAVCAADELCSQILSVAVGWQVYAATENPMSLAYVGLTQFIPNVALALIAGQAADRLDRRKILSLTLLVQALAAAALFGLCAAGVASVLPVYCVLLVLGVARAFSTPVLPSMLPHLVNDAEFPRAVAATSSAHQMSSIIGPALGGLIYAFSPPGLFAVVAALYFTAALTVGQLGAGYKTKGTADQSVLGGVRYVLANRLLLALTSLDLFAVLLGGVTALLPIYAKDILAVGPAGLGCLRCAPGVGAAAVGFVLARRTIQRRAGTRMLASVAGFGVATIVFALSRNVWLSLAALIALGGFDMVSMVIRGTLVQISTPDAMRGRVNAVNGVFISASSELGQFESGAAAALFGAVPSALLGGVGTLAAVALWTWIFPELRQADKLEPVPCPPQPSPVPEPSHRKRAAMS
jgi:predicted MFS family arabinose efflux permease